MIFFHKPFGRLIVLIVMKIRQYDFIKIPFASDESFSDKFRFAGQSVSPGPIFVSVMTFAKQRRGVVHKIDGVHSDFPGKFNLVDLARAHNFLLHHCIHEIHKRHLIRFL